MNNEERLNYFSSGLLQRIVQIELLDWVGYWTSTGLDEITDLNQREQTRIAINMILADLPSIVKKVSRLIISDDIIKNTSVNSVTNEMIRTIIVAIMANKLEWVTGIRSDTE